MQKVTIELDLTDAQYEVLQTVAAAECDSVKEYCGEAIRIIMKMDVENYFSEQPRMRRMLEAKLLQ